MTGDAITELEQALSKAHQKPGSLAFRDHVTLAMMLADFYRDGGSIDKARDMLAAELSHVEEVHRKVKISGNVSEKREVADGLSVLRDHHTQIALIGKPAPEISIKDWINSGQLTLSRFRGKVVLIEFWATWCKPCHAMFPKLSRFIGDYSELGLNVLALTRYYFSLRDMGGSQEKERNVIANFVSEHDIQFPVGIAEDAATQMKYGAVGLPTLVLIDRRGKVRQYAQLGSDEGDAKFEEEVQRCLGESA